MKKNFLKEKSFAFAIRIIHLNRYLQQNEREFNISKQIVRSGTAVGALIREAEHAESKKDFIHKLSIGLKEANETKYWLELITSAGFLTQNMYESLNHDCEELLKMLIASVKTSKQLK